MRRRQSEGTPTIGVTTMALKPIPLLCARLVLADKFEALDPSEGRELSRDEYHER